MMVSVTAEDKDPYAKAPKINLTDFRRERRDECLHQMSQPMATDRN